MRGNKDIKETPLATAGVLVSDVLKFWDEQPFNLNTVTVNGNSLLSNCDLCFLKGASQILSLIKEKPERAVWWAKQEGSITNAHIKDGEMFRKDRPSYAQMLKFSQEQKDMFYSEEESIACFCGD